MQMFSRPRFSRVIQSVTACLMILVGGHALAKTAHASEASSDLTIVVSIPPLKMLVEDLVADNASVTMISQNGSPHHKVLRPSDVAKLESATLIAWVGAELEPYLERFTQRHSSKSLAMFSFAEFSSAEDVMIHSEKAARGHDDHSAHEHHNHDHLVDPHLWLNPEAVEAFATALISRMVQLDPMNAELYQSRLAAFTDTLNLSVTEWKARLVGQQDRPYFVYHDAYGYLEAVLGIQSMAVLTVNPGVKPSAKKLGQLARQLDGVDAACVFYEPEFQQVRLDRVTNARLSYALLDPLGATFQAKPTDDMQYIAFIGRLVDGFADCLSKLR